MQQIHERIPAFRQMLYGKDKSMYVPQKYSLAKKRQYLFEQLKKYTNVMEFLKFTKDIRAYDFKKPYPISFLQLLSEIDFTEIENDYETFTYIYYDILQYKRKNVLIYLVQYKKTNYICGCSFQLNNKVQKVSGINESRIEYLLTKLIDKQESEPDEVENNNWLEHPLVSQVGQMIIGLIGSKLQGTNTQLNGTSIAGVNENDPGYLLSCLMSKGVTVEHLQKLNNMPDSQLRNLLLML
jgi:hypothetical protein